MNKAADGAQDLIRISATVTAEHHRKFKALGGSLWLRQTIDREYERCNMGKKGQSVGDRNVERS